MKSKSDPSKPPKLFKRHRKQDREARRTCWRSIKWKIAILCCSSQGRKGSSLINNLFVLAFVFSQVYLLHRFGSHRTEYESLSQMKRSYPLRSGDRYPLVPPKSVAENHQSSNPPTSSSTEPPPDLAINQIQKTVRPEPVEKEPSQPVRTTSPSTPVAKLLFDNEKGENNIEEELRDLEPPNEVVSMEPVEIDEDRLKLIEENYDGIEYAENAPIVNQPVIEAVSIQSVSDNDQHADEEVPSSNMENVPVDPPVVEAAIATDSAALDVLENPGDYYLNEGDSDYDFVDSSRLNTANIFFDIPDPDSVPPEQCHVLNDIGDQHAPLYTMNKEKFIVPVLPWGPVEQLRGFRETLLMAFYLNRTICIPPFWREKAETSLKGVGEALPAGARIDLNELNKMVETCKIEDIKANCGSKFTSIMLAQNICSKYTRKRIQEMEQRLNLEAIYTDDECTLADGVHQTPIGFNEKMVKISTTKEDVMKLFTDTEAKCSLWLYPYINFIETEKRLLIPFMSRGSPVEGKWLKDIVKYTPRPRFVLDICDQFQAKFDLTKSTFLAIHWNFEKDFKDACTKKSDQFYCDLKVNSTEAFQGLANYVKAHNQKTRLKAVYFSASVSMLQDVMPTLQSVWKTEFDGLISLLTREDLLPLVADANCMGVDHADVLDTAEMEMCYRSAAFLRAQYSIWSRTVDFERRATHARTLADKLFTEIVK